MSYPRIIEKYSKCGVNIGKIVKRILKYAPKESIDGIKFVKIMDGDEGTKGFACYIKEEKEIQLFVNNLVKWQPWILKKSYIFPYITVGLALGHEIDHHVTTDNYAIDREKSAENNAFKYIYPSLGIFKPIANLLIFFFNLFEKPTKGSGLKY